ncbi:DoxX family protein [Galbibacter pacificus]|uniref:DoxX family protein n=1 Tax=Galbibacter pacificus TaxID=2996052 RepID=A0ABT6FN01_9FLAO|nr:DoxX family protein [Galbibacter pacificus]MDG3581161.1 DoxX family protein [Galbibacter pacificus]MDG3584639.1 DoxX family protein [Galbibacter pacificus]
MKTQVIENKNNKSIHTKNKIVFWIATSIIFLWEGLMPLGTLLFAHEYFNAGTKPLGYPDYFAYSLIVCKIIGATALMLPKLPIKLREWAYAGLTFNLVFAVISHLVVDKNIGYILMPVVIGVILSVSYYQNQKIQNNG